MKFCKNISIISVYKLFPLIFQFILKETIQYNCVVSFTYFLTFNNYLLVIVDILVSPPQIRWGNPLNLSMLVSRGKYSNDPLSNMEWTKTQNEIPAWRCSSRNVAGETPTAWKLVLLGNPTPSDGRCEANRDPWLSSPWESCCLEMQRTYRADSKLHQWNREIIHSLGLFIKYFVCQRYQGFLAK